ncbi:MAG: hypothetical protein A2V72_02575 [Candidatus Nealsonbacteria bacterium RBG_13_37_56]|uniref:DUF11 domain-containing protein n=1 Tax=Candidatus Nealsonbacteria bacterium RBG_13_37_56 TaxID=1801661 RepID=A0A1G2DVK4_9BACT|nr:MAG: hypothetical protein A2V72_02575 [Candidatus Nealsonbacteria bacterium RBG_13_37_56]
MRKYIFIAIFVLALGLGLAGYWYWQQNPYSKEVLKLEILGPDIALASYEVTYTVKYKNNGDIRLEEPRLIFEFPEYTLLEPGASRRIEIGPEELGDIYPGEEKTFQFKGRLLGKEKEVKTAKAWLSYQPKNLQARYESTTSFSTTVDFVPLTFNFDLASKVEAGREFDFSINYFSSLDYPFSNLGIKVLYPDGFEFIQSAPKGLDNSDFEIVLLNPAEGGRIEIQGKLSGNLNEQKIFKATIGIWKDDEFIVLKEITRGTEITKPQLSVFQQINSQSNYIANPGDMLHYEIFFRNISDEPFQDLFLALTLEGDGFDFDTVKAESGQFQQGDNSIIWDWRSVPKLKFLDQGKEGKVEFWINLKESWSSGEKEALLKSSILISQVKEEFETKVNSKLEISQQASYEDEVFGNSGPMPPEAGNSTTHTVIWQVKNYFNDLKNVKVKAVLPSNVRLTGKIFPESESSKFAFDSGSREIVWMIGDMEAGTGIFNDGPNIAFQISLTPDLNQRNTNALLINEARISGEDQWTESAIEVESDSVKTASPVR